MFLQGFAFQQHFRDQERGSRGSQRPHHIVSRATYDSRARVPLVWPGLIISALLSHYCMIQSMPSRAQCDVRVFLHDLSSDSVEFKMF